MHWAQDRASFRGMEEKLGIQAIQGIKWCGARGMKWRQLSHTIQLLGLHLPCPRAIVIHVGSNDIGSVPCHNLRRVIRRDLFAIHNLFPTAVVIVSALLPRLNWDRSFILDDKVEKKRKLLNSFMKRLVSGMGGNFITHEEITADTPGLYRGDGVHLSDVGNDLFLMELNDALDKLF